DLESPVEDFERGLANRVRGAIACWLRRDGPGARLHGHRRRAALDIDADARDRGVLPIAPKPIERDDNGIDACIEVAELADDRQLLLSRGRWDAERLPDVQRSRDREPLRHDDPVAVCN